jgi:hypothetical protein
MSRQTEEWMPLTLEPRFDTTLANVTTEVLETMFFAEAARTECEHGWLDASFSVRVSFRGSHSGDMLLSVSPEAADSLAPAFLGIDPLEMTDAPRIQVLLELANILCGAVLSHFWPESQLALAAPEVTVYEPLGGPGLHGCFVLEEGKLAVWIALRSTPR